MEYLPFPLPVVPPPPAPKVSQAVLQRTFTEKLFREYWRFSPERADRLLRQKPPRYWEEQGERRALELFHAAAARVPAYKDFLRKHRVQPARIRTIKDFRHVPPVDKKNYLRAYSIEQLCWDGRITDMQMISVSSGSSGEPFFWPRGGLLELETTYLHEQLLWSFFHIDTHSTVLLDCFAMGMYIAGPITLNSALRVSQKGYPLLVMTPGLAMDDIMRIISNVGARFDQIVLAGYPPYIKDVIEEARNAGVDWSKRRLRLILAGEGFSEQWRDYVAELGGGINAHDSIINLFGTADASAVAYETPEAIVIRRHIDHDDVLRTRLFGGRYPNRLPTLVQYLPTQKYFEEIGNELHFTTTGGIPLLRYNIRDDGGVIPYEEVERACEARGHDVLGALRKAAPDAPSWKLPFAYLYGRSDFTVVLYGANIYPENIKAALDSNELKRSISGRFTMLIEHRRNQDPYLVLHVELARSVKATRVLQKRVRAIMIHTLLTKNDEYHVIYNAKGRKAWPVIRLHPKGDEKYFSRKKNKQKWKG